MKLPKPIQRRRSKGFRLPEGTVCVSRPRKFGNPFRPYTTVSIIASELGIEHSGPIRFQTGSVAECLAWYRIWAVNSLRLHARHGIDWLAELRDAKYLACWCPLDWPCHRNELIELLKYGNDILGSPRIQ